MIYRKKVETANVLLLPLFLQTAHFVDGDVKIFLLPSAGHPSYATGSNLSAIVVKFIGNSSNSGPLSEACPLPGSNL